MNSASISVIPRNANISISTRGIAAMGTDDTSSDITKQFMSKRGSLNHCINLEPGTSRHAERINTSCKTLEMQQDLSNLLDKIGAIENKLNYSKQESKALSHISELRYESIPRLQLPQKNSLEEELGQIYSARKVVPKLQEVPKNTSSKPLLLSGRYNPHNNKATDLPLREIRDSANRVTRINNTESIVKETKHELLMQLTTSIEKERRTHSTLNQELSTWKSKCGSLDQECQSLQKDIAELQNNIESSKLLRRQHPHCSPETSCDIPVLSTSVCSPYYSQRNTRPYESKRSRPSISSHVSYYSKKPQHTLSEQIKLLRSGIGQIQKKP